MLPPGDAKPWHLRSPQSASFSFGSDQTLKFGKGLCWETALKWLRLHKGKSQNIFFLCTCRRHSIFVAMWLCPCPWQTSLIYHHPRHQIPSPQSTSCSTSTLTWIGNRHLAIWKPTRNPLPTNGGTLSGLFGFLISCRQGWNTDTCSSENPVVLRHPATNAVSRANLPWADLPFISVLTLSCRKVPTPNHRALSSHGLWVSLCGCHNKIPQTRWPEATEMYNLAGG